MSEASSSQPDATDIRHAGMNLLARREHSRQELRDKLLRRFGSEGPIEQALDRLEAEGLQSDERFAEAYVRSRERQGKGPLRIAQELRHKGVADEWVETVLDEQEERWWELAKAVRAKRFGDQPITSPRERARQIRFLQYRGFSSEQTQAAIASVPTHP